MEIINKPIEVILHTDKQGNSRPIRFRLEDEEGNERVFKVNKICTKDINKHAGNKMLKLTCLVAIHDEERLCDLQYDCNAMKWVLLRM